jgi:hypothetical protein
MRHDGDDDNAATGSVGALSTPPCTAEASAVRIPVDDGSRAAEAR